MKKLLCAASLLGVIACQSSPNTRAGDGLSGAATPTGAIQLFFDAIRAQDLQAMSVAWGTKDGPTRDHIPHEELEKREVVLQCYFNNDSYRILGPTQDGTGGQSFRVELVRGDKRRTTTVSTIEGPSKRWYVQNLDIAAVRDMCGAAPTTP